MTTIENDDPMMTEFINCMAWDEIDQMVYADTPESWEDLTMRMALRRQGLDAISARRYAAMDGEHDDIQTLFDFLGLPLGDLDESLTSAGNSAPF